jgi:hypothetical protein
MDNVHMSGPVSLSVSTITRSFVYCREYGLFYVSGAYHQAAMSLLLAWQHKLHNGVDVADLLNARYSYGTADLWIKSTPGAAFMSSVGKGRIVIGSDENLNSFERRIFGNNIRLF